MNRRFISIKEYYGVETVTIDKKKQRYVRAARDGK